MKATKYIVLLLLAVLLSAASSCKKDDTATKPYLVGSVCTDFPAYIQKGVTVTAKAWGVSYPEDIVWKWYASSMTADTLYCNPVTLRVPDSLGQFGVMIGAFSEGYYALTTTVLFNTIDTAGSETFYGPVESAEKFKDDRDGSVYDIVSVGNLQWFAQNLSWDGAGVSYRNSKILDKFFGRFYTWEEARSACPPNWRLPDNDDWCDLASAVSGRNLTFGDPDNWAGVGEKLTVQAFFINGQMWEYWPGNEHTNTVGWNGIPMGHSLRNSDMFAQYGEYAYFWSASEASADKAYYRWIFKQSGTMPFASSNKNDLSLSVRCVRDR